MVDPEKCKHYVLEKEIPLGLKKEDIWKCVYCGIIVKLKKINYGIQKKVVQK